MFIFALAAIQVVVSPGPPGPRIIAPGAMHPAGNEVLQVGDLTLSNGYVGPQSIGNSTQGGFSIRNVGEASDRVISVSSPLADQVTMWRIETEGAQQGEVEQAVLEIPGRSQIAQSNAFDINRGRIRLRFNNLRSPLNATDGIPMTLRFERAGEVTLHAYPMVPDNRRLSPDPSTTLK